jgi:hypothetical protein
MKILQFGRHLGSVSGIDAFSCRHKEENRTADERRFTQIINTSAPAASPICSRGNTAASTLKVARYRRERMPKEWERTVQERTAQRILASSVLPVWHAACVEAALPLLMSS